MTKKHYVNVMNRKLHIGQADTFEHTCKNTIPNIIQINSQGLLFAFKKLFSKITGRQNTNLFLINYFSITPTLSRPCGRFVIKLK